MGQPEKEVGWEELDLTKMYDETLAAVFQEMSDRLARLNLDPLVPGNAYFRMPTRSSPTQVLFSPITIDYKDTSKPWYRIIVNHFNRADELAKDSITAADYLLCLDFPYIIGHVGVLNMVVKEDDVMGLSIWADSLPYLHYEVEENKVVVHQGSDYWNGTMIKTGTDYPKLAAAIDLSSLLGRMSPGLAEEEPEIEFSLHSKLPD